MRARARNLLTAASMQKSPPPRLIVPLCVLALHLLACECPAAQHPSAIRVAAASDLARAFEDLSADFTRKTGVEVKLTFGSSGLLARQLREGAPFDVFAAASASYVDDVVRAGVCDGETRARYGRGRLALWTRGAGLGAAPPRTLDELLDPRFARIAIANPEHAPYGIAAREALRTAGLWSRLEPRVVYAENVRHALQLARTGDVDASVVALPLVSHEQGAFLPIDPVLHGTIDQQLVACTSGRNSERGRDFAAFVSSAPAREVMRRHGFLLPGEALMAASR